MLWVSDGERVGFYEHLGPHKLPFPPAEVSENRYLMDGIQRVSTLYGAMRAQDSWNDYDATQDEAVEDFVVYADLDAVREQDRFIRRVDIADSAFSTDPSRFLPLNIVLDSRELIRFQRQIPTEQDARLEASDSVSGAFRQYKVPLITLKSASLEVVTKSFERINSRGADMSELHMLNALSYSSSFDLLKRDRELREDVLAPLQWDHIDQEVVLRCLKLRLGADIYTTNPDDVSAAIKKNPQCLDEVFAALERCAKFLKGELGISRPEMVPYRMQIVSMVAALSISALDTDGTALIDWFWLSTYTEAFGSSARQSQNALSDLVILATTGKFEWTLRDRPAVRPLNELRVDFRSARVKALALALAKRKDLVTNSKAGTELLSRYGRDGFAQIVLDNSLRGRAGSRFLVEPEYGPSLKNSIQFGTLNDQEKSVHFISDLAELSLGHLQFEEFARVREADIFSYEVTELIKPAADRLGLTIVGTETPGRAHAAQADLF